MSWPQVVSGAGRLAMTYRDQDNRLHLVTSTDGIPWQRAAVQLPVGAIPTVSIDAQGTWVLASQVRPGSPMTSVVRLSTGGVRLGPASFVSATGPNVHDTALPPRRVRHLSGLRRGLWVPAAEQPDPRSQDRLRAAALERLLLRPAVQRSVEPSEDVDRQLGEGLPIDGRGYFEQTASEHLKHRVDRPPGAARELALHHGTFVFRPEGPVNT